MTPINSLSEEEWLALVHQALSMPHAPAHQVQNALDIFGHEHVERPLRQRWVAVLRFDSWARPQIAAGMRSGPSAVRQLVFSAEGFDVDLRISPVAGEFALSGQLLGAQGQAHIDLVAMGRDGAERSHRSVEFDASGEFRLEGVQPGTYLVTVRVDDQEVVLTSIDVGLAGPAIEP